LARGPAVSARSRSATPPTSRSDRAARRRAASRHIPTAPSRSHGRRPARRSAAASRTRSTARPMAAWHGTASDASRGYRQAQGIPRPQRPHRRRDTNPGHRSDALRPRATEPRSVLGPHTGQLLSPPVPRGALPTKTQ
jgi:hypothetical protein